MTTKKILLITLALSPILALFAWFWLSYYPSHAAKDLKYSKITTVPFPDEFEPSGLVLCNGVLYIVSDEGSIASGKRTFDIIYKDGQTDFEGITCSDSSLYIVEEGDDDILKVTFEGEILERYDIKRTFEGKKVISKKGDGLESLAFIREDAQFLYFVTANQSDELKGKDKSAVMFIQVDKMSHQGIIHKYIPTRIKDISGMMVKGDLLYFISDTTNLLYESDFDLNIKRYLTLPGESQEGIFIDFNRSRVYIADDEGSLLVLSGSVL